MAAGCAATPPAEEPVPPQRDWGSPATTNDDEDITGEYVDICVRKTTLVRTEYRPCDDGEKGYAWYFVPMSAKVPAIGKKVRTGTFDEPTDADGGYRAPRKGGKGRHVMILDDQDRVEICVQKRMRIRVSDARCDDEDSDYAWYYILLSGQVPAVGKKAMNGSFRWSPIATTLRARTGGGKGSKVAFEASDEDTDSVETDDTDTDSYIGTDTDTDIDSNRTRTRPRTRSGRR